MGLTNTPAKLKELLKLVREGKAVVEGDEALAKLESATKGTKIKNAAGEELSASGFDPKQLVTEADKIKYAQIERDLGGGRYPLTLAWRPGDLASTWYRNVRNAMGLEDGLYKRFADLDIGTIREIKDPNVPDIPFQAGTKDVPIYARDAWGRSYRTGTTYGKPEVQFKEGNSELVLDPVTQKFSHPLSSKTSAGDFSKSYTGERTAANEGLRAGMKTLYGTLGGLGANLAYNKIGFDITSGNFAKDAESVPTMTSKLQGLQDEAVVKAREKTRKEHQGFAMTAGYPTNDKGEITTVMPKNAKENYEKNYPASNVMGNNVLSKLKGKTDAETASKRAQYMKTLNEHAEAYFASNGTDQSGAKEFFNQNWKEGMPESGFTKIPYTEIIGGKPTVSSMKGAALGFSWDNKKGEYHFHHIYPNNHGQYHSTPENK